MRGGPAYAEGGPGVEGAGSSGVDWGKLTPDGSDWPGRRDVPNAALCGAGERRASLK